MNDAIPLPSLALRVRDSISVHEPDLLIRSCTRGLSHFLSGLRQAGWSSSLPA